MAQNNKEEPIEKQLWKAANKLRKNINAAEYKDKAKKAGNFIRHAPLLSCSLKC